MCIWKVAAEDRHCEFCIYNGECERPGRKNFNEDFERVITAMEKQFPRDLLLSRYRDRQVVWARYIIMDQLRSLGYTVKRIGAALNMNHSTVVYANKEIDKMHNCPEMYAIEYDIWEKFQQSYNQQL